MSLTSRIVKRLLSLNSQTRTIILILVDATLILVAVNYLLWQLQLPQDTIHQHFSRYWILTFALIVGLPLYLLTGQYKSLTRYVTSSILYNLAARNFILVILLFSIAAVFSYQPFPISGWANLFLMLTFSTASVRLIFRDVLFKLLKLSQNQKRVVIYGAGEAGAQLAASLSREKNYRIVAFIDDSPQLQNRYMNGIAIESPLKLYALKNQIDLILIAIPSLSREHMRRLLGNLQSLGVPVLKIPSLDELTSDLGLNTLKPISIDDLLGRDGIFYDPKILSPFINNTVVCVTGAGGSIGSELCKQIIQLNPSKLILIDSSEPSLFAIEQELINQIKTKSKVRAVLGNATDEKELIKLFSHYKVEFVIHAAAYKHVPLVEANPLVGISNNVFSTLAVCNAAKKTNVKKVILISTDKAVRPTNVMGASKRLSEIIFQAFSEEEDIESSPSNKLNKTKISYSMVRFGNVLGSSGSVVPTFTKQIASGGPITLTHPEIVRYFMTIYEASVLVLQAAVLAEGGEVFLLDMGKPVPILNLAKQMVHLSGLTVKDHQNPDGDIEIIYTGLRPGEKLFEELLIDAKSLKTPHPLIYRAVERSVPASELWPKVNELKEAVINQDSHQALSVLSNLVPEWKRKDNY